VASDHHPLCDQKHTPRQACNRALASTGAEPLIVSAPAARASAVQRTKPEPPTRQQRASLEDAPAEELFELGLDRANEPIQPARPDFMPDPSPWATRAWEDTAAAVGAMAPPPPPRPAPVATPQAGWFQEHLSFVGGIAAASLALMIIIRRRSASRE
jgi:hypothetical protein